jgi:O-antigen ligase
VLSSFGGSIVAMIAALLVILNDVSKENYRYVFIVFASLLLFSDSNSSLFYQSGKNGKDLAIVAIAIMLFVKNKTNFQYSYLRYFAAYLGIALLGLLVANFSMLGLQKLFSYGLVIWIIPVLLLLIFEKGEGLVFFQQLIVTFTVIYFISIILSRVNPANFAQFGRFNGIHRNPNGVGIFSTLFIMNMYLIKEKVPQIFSKRVFLAILSIFIFSIVLASSRNSIIALTLFFVFSLFRVRFFVGFVLIIGIALGYSYLMLLIEQLVLAADLEKELRLDTLSYASGRIYIWQACWMEIQNNFWLGHGFSFEEYSNWDKAYVKILPMLIHNYGNVHNSYLTIWLNTGLLGLLAYLIGLITYVVKHQFNSRRLVPFIFATIFMAFFESFMVASLNPYTWQLWFAFFIASIQLNKAPSSEIQEQKQETTMDEIVPSVY